MVIDIQSVLTNYPKPDSVTWAIYKDSSCSDLIVKKENDPLKDYKIKYDLKNNKIYYLKIELHVDDKIFNVKPIIISYSKKVGLLSNNIVPSPEISPIVNKDDDGNPVSITFKGSDYSGIYLFKDSIWLLKDEDDVLINKKVIKGTSLTIPVDNLSSSKVYRLDLLYRDINGISNTLVPYRFIYKDGVLEQYYVPDNKLDIVDKVIKHYLDNTKMFNALVADNILLSLLLKNINENVIKKIDDLISDYNNNKDINDALNKLKFNVNNLVNNLNINGIKDKSISEVVNELKEEYNK